MNVWMGVPNPEFRPIKRNRDDKGRILTYTVKTESGVEIEVNSLKQARMMAIKII